MVPDYCRDVNYFIVIISHKNRAKPELAVTPVSPAGAWASCPRLWLAVKGVDTRQPRVNNPRQISRRAGL